MPPVLDSTLVQGSYIRNSTVKKGNPNSGSSSDNYNVDESGCFKNLKKSCGNKTNLNKLQIK